MASMQWRELAVFSTKVSQLTLHLLQKVVHFFTTISFLGDTEQLAMYNLQVLTGVCDKSLTKTKYVRINVLSHIEKTLQAQVSKRSTSSRVSILLGCRQHGLGSSFVRENQGYRQYHRKQHWQVYGLVFHVWYQACTSWTYFGVIRSIGDFTITISA